MVYNKKKLFPPLFVYLSFSVHIIQQPFGQSEKSQIASCPASWYRNPCFFHPTR